MEFSITLFKSRSALIGISRKEDLLAICLSYPQGMVGIDGLRALEEVEKAVIHHSHYPLKVVDRRALIPSQAH
jgi:hypothetical protein